MQLYFTSSTCSFRTDQRPTATTQFNAADSTKYDYMIGTFIVVLKSGSDTLLWGIDRPVSFNFSADADGPRGAKDRLGLAPKRPVSSWPWRVTDSTVEPICTCSWAVGGGGPPIIPWMPLSNALRSSLTIFHGARLTDMPPCKGQEQTHKLLVKHPFNNLKSSVRWLDMWHASTSKKWAGVIAIRDTNLCMKTKSFLQRCSS